MTTVKLACIGVLELDDAVAALLMTTRSGVGALYCLELDRATALFVSPLYEHTLTLIASRTELSEQARATLEQVDGAETLYQAVEWQSWQCLLQQNLSATVLPTKLAAVLGRTLFLQSARPASPAPLIQKLYAPHAQQTQYCTANACLPLYMEMRRQCRVDLGKKRSLYTGFWQLVEKRDEALIRDSVNRLFAYARKDAVYPTMRDLATQLLSWRQPGARLIAHKIDEMAALQKLHATLGAKGDGEHVLAKHATFALLNGALVKSKVLHDGATLVRLLWAQMDTECEVVIGASLFAQYQTLVDQLLAGGALGRLLDLLYAKKATLAERCVAVRRRCLTHFLLPLLVATLERHARLNSQTDRSTVERITLHTVYQAYTRLFHAKRQTIEDNDAAADAEIPFALDVEDDTRAAGKHLFTFDRYDFNLALTALHQGTGAAPWHTDYKWRIPPQLGLAMLEKKSTLFYLEMQPALLEREAKIDAHYSKHIFEELLTPRICESHELIALFDSIAVDDDPSAQQQQYRFLLFSPQELQQGRDIEVLKELALDDVYATAVLRESSTNHFFRGRLASAFASDVSAEQWQQELYVESANFIRVDKRAELRTVLVPDAHLLSSTDLLNLLRWLICHRATVKRIALFGSLDLLPLSQNGQPFVDLLLRVDPQRVKRLVFDEERRARLLSELLGQWTQYKWPRDTDERARFIRQQQMARAPAMYVLQEGADVEDFFHYAQRYKRIVLYHLRLGGGSNTKPKLELQQRKKSLVRIVPLALDALLQHQRTTPDFEYFIVGYDELTQLRRNQALMLFTTLSNLLVVAPSDAVPEPLRSLEAHFNEEKALKRPNLRYTYSALPIH